MRAVFRNSHCNIPIMLRFSQAIRQPFFANGSSPALRVHAVLAAECCVGKVWYFPKMRGPQYRPHNIIILTIGTEKKVTPNFGKPPYQVLSQ